MNARAGKARQCEWSDSKELRMTGNRPWTWGSSSVESSVPTAKRKQNDDFQRTSDRRLRRLCPSWSINGYDGDWSPTLQGSYGWATPGVEQKSTDLSTQSRADNVYSYIYLSTRIHSHRQASNRRQPTISWINPTSSISPTSSMRSSTEHVTERVPRIPGMNGGTNVWVRHQWSGRKGVRLRAW